MSGDDDMRLQQVKLQKDSQAQGVLLFSAQELDSLLEAVGGQREILIRGETW